MKSIRDITITFYYGYHKYILYIYEIERLSQSYAMRLRKDYKYSNSFDDEIFSTWIDNAGGEVAGNCEIYKTGYDKVIDYCYEIFNKVIVEKK